MNRRLNPFWRWLSFFSLLLGCLPSRGAMDPAWFARSWHTEDGLPEHTIVALQQTANGYLWLATYEGLFRFDGVRFHEFPAARRSGHPGAQLRLMVRDRMDRLWLAKDRGSMLCLSQGALSQLFDLESAGFKGQPRCMVEDGEGNIWVSDSAGSVARIGSQTEIFGAAEGLGQGICRLATDVRGQLWYSQSGKTGIFRDGRFVPMFSLEPQPGALTRAMNGGVWLGSGLDLYRCQEEAGLTAVATLVLQSGPPAEVTALHEDKSRGLWIGTTSGGLFRYDGRSLHRVDSTLPAVTAITEDSEGNIWVSARGGGLSRYRPRAAEVFGLSSGLPFVAVRSACEDAAGNLWAVGESGALGRRMNDTWKLVGTDEGWKYGRITCLTVGTRGEIVLGTQDQGVFTFVNETFSGSPANQALTNRYIRSLFTSTDGALWIGPNAGGTLCRWRDGQMKVFGLPPGCNNVRAMVQGPDDTVWAASSGRLLRVRGEEMTDETDRVIQTPRAGIRSLYMAGDGSLWIGFSGQGLGWWKDGRYFEFHSEHGLRDQYASQILEDDQGRLWLGGNRGIFHVALSELKAVAEGRATQVRSVVVGRGEGLPNLQAAFGVWPLGGRCGDGRLFMPTLNGLVVIQPALLRGNPEPPPVVIEAVRVNGQLAAAHEAPGEEGRKQAPAAANLQTLSGPLRIGPGVRQMAVEFTALSFASPENVSLRYKLEGLDQAWIDAGATRFAPYTRIPPGTYQFRVTACGHDGVWNETGAVLAISVQPHLWELGWVRFAALFAGAGLFTGGVLVTVRRRYRRKIERLEQRQALERERARIAQDLHDDLGAGLVEINFGSELAQDPALGMEEVREHMREIGTRAREMVTALDEIVWAVNPKQDSVNSLATYFCQYAQHFLNATPMRCHLDVARDLRGAPLNAEQRHNLFLAFKEALSNAVQHSGGTDLTVSIRASDQMLTIEVSDNGRGTGPASLPGPVGADGLGNMRRRLEQLGGRCELKSVPGQGTRVTFTVPLGGPVPRTPDNPTEVL